LLKYLKPVKIVLEPHESKPAPETVVIVSLERENEIVSAECEINT